MVEAIGMVASILIVCSMVFKTTTFKGTMLMIVSKSKVNEILPILYDEFGKKNVMKVNLVEYGTSKL